MTIDLTFIKRDMWKQYILYRLILALAVVTLDGCVKDRANRPTSVNLSAAGTDTLKWSILPVQEVLPMPVDISVTDSAVVVLGYYDNYWIHTFDKVSGERASSFVLRGQGPEDVVNAVAMATINDTSVSVYDTGTSRIHFIDLNSQSQQPPARVSTSDKTVWQAWGLSDSTALIKYPIHYTDNQPCRAFGTVNLTSGEQIAAYEELNAVFKDNPRLLIGQSVLALSPDKRHFVSATMIGGTLEFFEINDSLNIKSVESRLLFPAKISKESTKKPTYGFTAVCASNETVYTAFAGSENPDDATKIAIWDWQGNLLNCVATDHLIISLTIDSTTGTLYGVVIEEGVPVIAHIAIPEITSEN